MSLDSKTIDVLAGAGLSVFFVALGLGAYIGYSRYQRWRAAHPPSPEALLTAQVWKQIRLGADLDSASPQKSKTLLHRTSKGGFSKAVDALLGANASVDLVDHKGQTPLHKACAEGQIEVAKKLIQKGASIEARDDQGRSPLMLLMQSSYDGDIGFLISRSDVRKPNRAGETHLHLAADSANPTWIQALLAAGADAKAVDGKGQTVLGRLFRGQLSFENFCDLYFADCFESEKEEHTKQVLEELGRLNPQLRRLIEERIFKIAGKTHVKNPTALPAVNLNLPFAWTQTIPRSPEECKKAAKSILKDPYFSVKHQRWHEQHKIYLMGSALLKLKMKFKGIFKPSITDPTSDIDPCVHHLLIDKEDRQQAFQLACEFGKVKIAEGLLAHADVDPNLLSPKNVHPVHAAIRSATKLNLVFDPSLMRSAKIDLKKAVDGDGNTAAHAAAEVGARDFLEYLGMQGIDLTQPNSGGVTPLQKALEGRQESTTRFLVGKMEKAQLEQLKMGDLSLIEYAVVHAPPGLRDALNEKGIFFAPHGDRAVLEKALKNEWLKDLRFLKENLPIKVKEINQLIADLEASVPPESSELYDKLMLGIRYYLNQSAVEDKYKAQGKHSPKSEWMPIPFADYNQIRRGLGEFGNGKLLRFGPSYLQNLFPQEIKEALKVQQNFATLFEWGSLTGPVLFLCSKGNQMGSAFQQFVEKGLKTL